MKDDRAYLEHLRESIALVEQYAAVGRERYLASPQVQDAILHRLQVIAESTQRLSEPLKALHPEVDWRGLAGFRNVLVHDYLGVDIERVWQLVETKLPDLKQCIEQMLRELPSSS